MYHLIINFSYNVNSIGIIIFISMHNLSLKSVSVKSVYHTNIHTHNTIQFSSIQLNSSVHITTHWQFFFRFVNFFYWLLCIDVWVYLYRNRLNIIYNRHNRWHFLWLNRQFPFEKDILFIYSISYSLNSIITQLATTLTNNFRYSFIILKASSMLYSKHAKYWWQMFASLYDQLGTVGCYWLLCDSHLCLFSRPFYLGQSHFKYCL